MNFDQAKNLAISFLRANIVFSLWGHPGIGKSALGKLLADMFDLMFIDIRLGQIDPVDLNGFVHKDPDTGTFDYLPWARFPLEHSELPPVLDNDGRTQMVDGQVKRYKGWLIMLDEINTAPRQNLAAAYKLVHDRMVGSSKLHKKCRIMMGGNLIGEGLAGALPSPLVSRGAHIYMEPELTPTVRQILGPDISMFLTNYPKFIYQATQEPNTPFPTLRTWEMVRTFEQVNGEASLEAVAAMVGTSAAVSYIAAMATQRELQETLQGTAPFPLEQSQDLLDYLISNPVELHRHMHRFPGEWQHIAKARLAELTSEISSI